MKIKYIFIHIRTQNIYNLKHTSMSAHTKKCSKKVLIKVILLRAGISAQCRYQHCAMSQAFLIIIFTYLLCMGVAVHVLHTCMEVKRFNVSSHLVAQPQELLPTKTSHWHLQSLRSDPEQQNKIRGLTVLFTSEKRREIRNRQ